MVSIIDKYIVKPWKASALMKVIFINVAVYMFFLLCGILFAETTEKLFILLSFPTDLSRYIHTPWTIFSYMWIHGSLWHLVFNMCWLYWMGGMFLQIYSVRELMVLYVSGGLLGAVVYMLYSNVIYSQPQLMLLGASAAVMAIITSTALRRMDFKCNIPLLGAVKLKWIALGAFVLFSADFITETGGSRFAHIGGVIAGIIFLMVTAPRRIKKQVSKEVKYKNIDTIIEKVKRSGYSALSEEEKRRLFDVEK